MGPGDQVWEKFGHNAIWIHDDLNGTDVAYHWGLFDFADKDFIPRFVQGRMRYSMGAFDMRETVDMYRQTNRTVWAQELNLTPAERLKLATFVEWNNRPENRHYRYDYYRDNCSTRVRDAIDLALGGVIERATEPISSKSTYRSHTSRLTQDDWPIFTGTMIGLGQPTDREINAWEEMFLPVRMKDRLKSVSVARGGIAEPLVKSERILVQATRPPEDVRIRRGWLSYFAIAVVILAIGAVMVKAGRRDGPATTALALASIWSLVAGLGGLFLDGLWAFTDHLYSYRNENVLQLTPISLVLLILLVRLIWIRRKSPGSPQADARRQTALKFARIVAGISVLGFVIQLLPGFDQVNGDVIALALPLHLGVIALLLGIGAKGEYSSAEAK